MKTEIKVGIAVFAALLLLGGLVSVSGDVFWKKRDGYFLEVYFTDARGLGEGSYVFVSGVKTGTVSDISLSNEGVRVVLSLPRTVLVPVDSTFIIATGGLLGESEVHVERGSSSESFQPGDRAKGSLPPSFDQILSRVEEDLQELKATFRHINDVLESPGVKDNLTRAFNEFPELVTDTREATVKISEAADSFREMTEKGKTEMARIGESVSQATGTLTATVQENRLPLNETMLNLRSSTERLENILSGFDSDKNGGEELRETVSSVKRAAQQMEAFLVEARQAFSGDRSKDHPVSRFRDVVDKADQVLSKLDRIEMGGQIGVHQTTSGNDGDRLIDLSFLIRDKKGRWSFETGVEDVGEDEQFNALMGWRWNDLVHFRGGIVRGDVGGGLTFDFRDSLSIPLDTTWLWWDDNGGQWKTDTFYEINRNWGIHYRHLHLDNENRDSVGVFYRF